MKGGRRSGITGRGRGGHRDPYRPPGIGPGLGRPRLVLSAR